MAPMRALEGCVFFINVQTELLNYKFTDNVFCDVHIHALTMIFLFICKNNMNIL